MLWCVVELSCVVTANRLLPHSNERRYAYIMRGNMEADLNTGLMSKETPARNQWWWWWLIVKQMKITRVQRCAMVQIDVPERWPSAAFGQQQQPAGFRPMPAIGDGLGPEQTILHFLLVDARQTQIGTSSAHNLTRVFFCCPCFCFTNTSLGLLHFPKQSSFSFHMSDGLLLQVCVR